MKKKRYISVGILFLLTLIFLHSADAVLGKDAGLTITLNPNITSYITNNYTTNNYTYSGGFAPHAPWLYNDSTDMYFNYSRLILEFYNRSEIDAKGYWDECSDASGCGYLTSSYNATYAATSADVTANRTDWLNRCYNITYESTYNASYLTVETEWRGNETAALKGNSTQEMFNACNNGTFQTGTELWNTSAQIWAVCDNGTFQKGAELWNTTAQIWAVCNNGTFALISEPLWSGNTTAALKGNSTQEMYNACNNNTFSLISEPRWAGNYTACGSSSKLYFSGTSLACNADQTGGGGGANISTTTCSGTDKVSGINNATGVVTCSADQGGGTGENYWVDGGVYLYPNTSYADNVFVMGWIKAYNWSNVTITEAQITDFGTYLESESDPLWQANSSLVVYTSQTSAWDKDSTDDITTANIASQNVNSSNYWDNYDTPPSTWTDTYNVTYHNYWVLNSSNMSYYWGNFKVSSGACSSVCTDADTDTWNTTQQMYNACNNGTFAPIVEPLWSGNATAALAGNTTQQMYNACNNGTFAPISEPLWSGNKTAALTGNSTEEMQDAAGALLGGTETGISVTYDDANNDIDFVVSVADAQVDNDLTINSTKPINTTSVLFIPQGQMICAYNASGSCVQWIKFNTSGVYIWGGG